MINLFEIAINFYQSCIIVYFCDKSLTGKRNWIAAILCAILGGAFLTLHQFFSLSIPDTLVFIVGYLYLKVSNRGDARKRIFCCILITVIWIISTTVFNGILQYVFKYDIAELFNDAHTRIIYVIVGNIFISITTFISCNLFKKNQYVKMPFSYSVLFIALLIMEWITAELLFTHVIEDGNNVEPLFFYSILALFCIIILSIVVYEYFGSILNRAVNAERTAQMLWETQKHQDEIKGMYKVMLKNQHDFKHRIAIAEALIKQRNNYSDEKLQELLDNNLYEPLAFLTGNETMDALLTAKKEFALANGISFIYRPYPLTCLPFDEVQFCVMISNILDNAIQEVIKIDNSVAERYIDINISRSLDMFCISCENPTAVENKSLFVSATNNQYLNGHGFGLDSVKQTVEEHQGMINIKTGNHTFKIDIMVPIAEEYDNDKSLLPPSFHGTFEPVVPLSLQKHKVHKTTK